MFLSIKTIQSQIRIMNLFVCFFEGNHLQLFRIDSQLIFYDLQGGCTTAGLHKNIILSTSVRIQLVLKIQKCLPLHFKQFCMQVQATMRRSEYSVVGYFFDTTRTYFWSVGCSTMIKICLITTPLLGNEFYCRQELNCVDLIVISMMWLSSYIFFYARNYILSTVDRKSRLVHGNLVQ